jgi:flagellar motor protein MotB
MASELKSRHDISRLFGAHRTVIAVVVSTMAGCSLVPDAANPIKWYQNTSYYIFGDDTAQPEGLTAQQDQVVLDRGAPPPGSNQPFPNLSTVPQRPAATSAQSRARIVEGLIADRDRARYSSDVIKRQGEPVAPLRRGQQTVAATSNLPPPPAVPPAPVSRAAATPPPANQKLEAVQPPAQAPSRRLVAPPMPRASANRAPTRVEEVYRANLAQRFVPQMASANGEPPSANSITPTIDRFETVFVSSSGVQLDTDRRRTVATPQVAAALPHGRLPAPAVRTTRRPLSGQRGKNSIDTFLARPSASISSSGERIATILFSVGSAGLTARDRNIIRDVALLHKERGGKVRIAGHASHRTRAMDPVRHKLVNYRISLQRANAVTAELTGQGVRRADVVVDARSDSEPVYYEVMPTGEAGNRRAEIYFVSN